MHTLVELGVVEVRGRRGVGQLVHHTFTLCSTENCGNKRNALFSIAKVNCTKDIMTGLVTIEQIIGSTIFNILFQTVRAAHAQ